MTICTNRPTPDQSPHTFILLCVVYLVSFARLCFCSSSSVILRRICPFVWSKHRHTHNLNCKFQSCFVLAYCELLRTLLTFSDFTQSMGSCKIIIPPANILKLIGFAVCVFVFVFVCRVIEKNTTWLWVGGTERMFWVGIQSRIWDNFPSRLWQLRSPRFSLGIDFCTPVLMAARVSLSFSIYSLFFLSEF